MTSPSSTPLVKVKPLVWTRNQHVYPGNDWWTAQVGGLKAVYSISSVPTADHFAYAWYSLNGDYLSADTLEAAQAAAELEWDRFVRSAIEP